MTLSRLALVSSVLVTAACGSGSPTAPSTPEATGSFLTGTWPGTLTMQRGPTAVPVTTATDWTVMAEPYSNGHGYVALAALHDPLLPATLRVTLTLDVPRPGATVTANGVFSTPCAGVLGGAGSATAHTLTLTIDGVSCAPTNAVFSGTIALAR